MLNFKHLMLGGLLSLSVLTPALSIASAADYSFQGDLTAYTYSPSSFTPTSDFTLSESDIKNITCSTNECDIYFHNDDFMCELGYSNDSWWASSCSDPFVAGVEYEVSVADGNPFDLFVMTDGQSFGGSDSDSSFNSSLYSTISGTLTNYTGSLASYVPYIIGFGIAVVAILAFRRIIKSWGRKLFRR